jgi:hypothetical protein
MISDIPDYLTAEDSKISFPQLLQKEYLNKDRVAVLNKARAILLPLENYRKDIPLCFKKEDDGVGPRYHPVFPIFTLKKWPKLRLISRF